MHDISLIDETQSYAAADGSGDARVDELQFCVIDGGLVRLDRALELADLRLLGIHLLLGDYTLVKEKCVALEVDLYVVELRLVFGELAFSLLEHHLVGAGIDFNERVACVNELALSKVHFNDLAVDAAANGYGVESRNGTEANEIDGKVALLRRSNHDRNGHSRGACAPFSLPAGAWSGCCARFARGVSAVIPDAYGDDSEDDNPEPPAALGLGGRCRGGITRTRFGKVYRVEVAHPFSPVSKSDAASESAEARQ